jgi:hypothetical protein
MAFCNSCGATLAPGTKFCNKCGAAVAGAPIPASAAPAQGAPAPSTTGGNSALKIVLIVVGALVVLGVLCLATIGLIGYHFVRQARVSQDGDHVKVETPFGSVDANKDPEQAARDIGVEIYPGAQVQNNGAASTTFAGIHTVAANFQSSDPVDKVCSFYKAKYPSAMASTSEENHCSIIFRDKQNMITINVHSSGDGTKIQISNITKNADSK